ncbi:hypothetical protein [Methanobrevibacter sp.]|uniref:hypothetical protein n=1 Tax=Methanobrevibacter sp. TaxID=66852 RepID=UPI0025D06ED3|nr:hypothetical protein [Methanobrevibacter sp.]MBR4448448.1 hypothetical protein [Methanobrevibacter sp.]
MAEINNNAEDNTFSESDILDKILAENTQEYFLKAKKELNLKEDSLTECKIALLKSQLNEKEEEYVRALSENARLKKECEAERSFNEKVKNSKSWKLMNVYRRIRG